ncbi:DUF1080 domain-containing protein [Halobacteria archaeon AArc-dxtr1]|nr:DUF1080 domain-containing protein [Halobacteria archaeon AArc-dxtr1]
MSDDRPVWIGGSDGGIEGETNPTLALIAGREYVVELTNADGRPHSFAIEDESGEIVFESAVLQEAGATEIVEFTATEEMAGYRCGNHPEEMHGDAIVYDAGDFEEGGRVEPAADAESASTARRRAVQTAGAVGIAGLVAGCLHVETGFTVSDLDPEEASVEQGESLDVSATITNVGEEDDTQTVELRIDDEVVDSQTISLEGADEDAAADVDASSLSSDTESVPSHVVNETTVTFEDVDTGDIDPGEYVHAIATEDDEATGTLTVEEATEETSWHRDIDVTVHPDEATDWDNYEVTKLLDQDDFMDIEVAPDGRVFYITRGHFNTGTGEGPFQVGYVDPDSGEQEMVFERETLFGIAGTSGVDTNSREAGGQGIAFDPDFENNGYVYIHYDPPLDEMDDIGPSPYDEFWDGEVGYFGYKLVSRFELTGGEIDPDSETEIIRIPWQYDGCCHHGGAVEFGPDGNLWLSLGDNSEIVSDYSPLDDRESQHPAYDAGRTSSNTADLRGSILRITPEEDGGYSIPDGNLKEVHEERTGKTFDEEEFKPEIFSMGYRNPYVVTVDEHTGSLFTATYSPGYGSWASSERGPSGIAGFRLICEPDYAGWPYFQGYYAYRRYDHDSGELGQPYWIDNPRNDSRNNTGIEELPPYEPDLIWQPQNGQDTLEHYEAPAWADMPRPGEVSWPEIQGSGGNNAGPTYRYHEEYGEHALPPFFEGKQFAITSYGTHQSIWYITFDEDGELELNEFLPDAPWVGQTPHHMEISPDGRAYVTNYGDGFYQIEYHGPQPEYQPPPEEEWPDRVEPSEDGLGAEPPEDATVLWDGDQATLDDWEHSDWSPSGEQPTGADPVWIEEDGYFETVPDSGDLRPEIDGVGEEIGDCHLHLEWRLPEDVEDTGNSGVFMMERYEIQILDDGDWNPDQLAGSYYLADDPHVLPLRPRGEWNEFDIFWRTPEFDDGEVVRYPQLTVFFNGVPTKYHFDVPGPNWGGINDFDDEEFGHPMTDDGEFADEWPFFLQEHGDVVQFRNIWYRDLPERPVEIDEPGDLPTYDTSAGEGEPERIDAGGPGTTGEPPEDADVLIDDALTLSSGDGDWESDDEYGDCQLHLEYRIPEDADGEGPWRGDSGVLMVGNYEINIVDTHDNPVEADQWAGAYTHQAPPHHDATREPGEWQQLDILWQSPRFEDGELASPAQVTALLNGVAVQTRLEVAGPNNGLAVREYAPRGERPLRIRESSDDVEIQNTWVRPFESDEVDDGNGLGELSMPYGLDAGGNETEGDIEIDGLAFDRSVDDSQFVATTGDVNTSAPGFGDTPEPEELEFEGTDHDLLYASEIHGEEFGFEIDVPDGIYDVTLHFSEWPYFEDDQVPRLQDVYVQDEQVLAEYELLRGEAQVETFEEVAVNDGELTIGIEVHPDSEDPYARLNGLEIHRVEGISTPYGLDAGGVDTADDVEIDGLAFDRSPDDNPYVSTSGGVTPSAADPDEVEFEGTDHDLLYTSELSEEAFGIDVEIEDGVYDVTLHFSDWPYFDPEDDLRLQNVSLQGETVLEEYRCEPGVAHPETFEGVEVTDGELSIELESHPDTEDPNAKLNGLEIHDADDEENGDDDDDIPEDAIEPGTTIDLDGQTTGWVGISPDEIEGDQNPTLVLAEGEEYTIGWSEGDGGNHNIEIRDEDGDVVDDLETELTGEPGDDQWLTFEASEEMAFYRCFPHASMEGEIDVR